MEYPAAEGGLVARYLLQPILNIDGSGSTLPCKALKAHKDFKIQSLSSSAVIFVAQGFLRNTETSASIGKPTPVFHFLTAI
jgi:hypothetical protein